jgi:hypothetical protein
MTPIVNEDAEIPVSVKVLDFTVNDVDTQWPEKEAFRKHYSTELGNLLAEYLGKKKAFKKVIRSRSDTPDGIDYLISGEYDFFERFELAKWRWGHNVARGSETLTVWIIQTTDNTKIFRKDFSDRHEDRTPTGIKASYSYLQPAFLSRIASNIVTAIRLNEDSR